MAKPNIVLVPGTPPDYTKIEVYIGFTQTYAVRQISIRA